MCTLVAAALSPPSPLPLRRHSIRTKSSGTGTGNDSSTCASSRDATGSIGHAGSPDDASVVPMLAPLEYRLGEQLGEGTFGTVHLGLNERTGGLFAVKRIRFARAGSGAGATRANAMRDLLGSCLTEQTHAVVTHGRSPSTRKPQFPGAWCLQLGIRN